MTRKYSSVSVNTTLASGVSSSATSMTVATGSASSFLGGITLAAGNVDQFTVAIDPDTVNEEIVFVTGASSDLLTIQRGKSGSSAITHSGGAIVKHVLTSDDLDYYATGVSTAVTASGTTTLTNKTVALVSNTVSGTTAQFNTALTDNDFATIAGTETLTNKTLTAPTLNSPVIAAPKVTRTINVQTGTSYTLVAGDQDALVTLTNASPITLTVPDSTFSAGQEIHLAQFGAGQVTVVAGGATTVNATPGLKLRAQNAAASLICTASNTFLLVGDLSA
jgi:hypothetical protein